MPATTPGSDAWLFDVMYQCRAIRRFTAEPVPDDLLVQLVDAALHAPSASNAQNWAFLIVRDTAQKQRLKTVWQRAWASTPTVSEPARCAPARIPPPGRKQ